MAELIIESQGHMKRGARHYRVDSFPCAIGRGFGNTIILEDPFVAAEHIVIEKSDDGWRVRQLDQINAVQFRGKPVKETEFLLHSGDEIILGKTALRFYAPTHPVAPARKLHDARGGLTDIGLSLLMLCGLLIFLLAVLVTNEYFNISDDLRFHRLIADNLPVLASALVWSAFWSLLAYVVRRRTDYLYFMALFVLYLLLDVVAETVIDYLAFNVGNTWLPDLVSYTTGGVLLASLLYFNMGRAFNLSARRRVVIANMFAWVFVLVVGFFVYGNYEEFNPDPHFSTVLKPPGALMVEPQLAEDFLNDTTLLFDKPDD
jgi:hypothetical protein